MLLMLWKRTQLLCGAALLVLLAACGAQVNEPQTGAYRATLQLPGGEAPLGLEVAKERDRFVLYLVNDTERTRVDNVTLSGKELAAVFPGYENTLRARMYRDRLEGAVTLIKAGGKEQKIPFKAVRGETHRFYKASLSDNADLAGRWEMTLTSDGEASPAVAILQQQ